ncbi:MAG: Cys-tRNA(Pro) deacylase [Flaviflexus sp.]|nr:Cys-tRNA(Pro) deacylase [Flaviflexus sp.]
MKATRALDILDRSGITYQLFEHEAGRGEGGYGRTAARALGVDPAIIFKTLMVSSTSPLVAVIPASGMLSLKKLARVQGVKSLELMDPRKAENYTGYQLGGISPLGLKRATSTVLDASALIHDTIHVSAGRRGWNIALSPHDLIELTGATVADIAEEGRHS